MFNFIKSEITPQKYTKISSANQGFSLALLFFYIGSEKSFVGAFGV